MFAIPTAQPIEACLLVEMNELPPRTSKLNWKRYHTIYKIEEEYVLIIPDISVIVDLFISSDKDGSCREGLS